VPHPTTRMPKAHSRTAPPQPPRGPRAGRRPSCPWPRTRHASRGGSPAKGGRDHRDVPEISRSRTASAPRPVRPSPMDRRPDPFLTSPDISMRVGPPNICCQAPLIYDAPELQQLFVPPSTSAGLAPDGMLRTFPQGPRQARSPAGRRELSWDTPGPPGLRAPARQAGCPAHRSPGSPIRPARSAPGGARRSGRTRRRPPGPPRGGGLSPRGRSPRQVVLAYREAESARPPGAGARTGTEVAVDVGTERPDGAAHHADHTVGMAACAPP